MTLYSINSNDLSYFSEPDREKVRKIFRILMEDTKHHVELLKLIVDLAPRS